MTKEKTQKNTESQDQNGKVLSGIVTSNKMNDTIVVETDCYQKHPKYGKYLKSSKKYQAHDQGNTAEIGDKVTIAEVKPISKNKKFALISIEK